MINEAKHYGDLKIFYTASIISLGLPDFVLCKEEERHFFRGNHLGGTGISRVLTVL